MAEKCIRSSSATAELLQATYSAPDFHGPVIANVIPGL
jgi:hypothetical protein